MNGIEKNLNDDDFNSCFPKGTIQNPSTGGPDSIHSFESEEDIDDFLFSLFNGSSYDDLY